MLIWYLFTFQVKDSTVLESLSVEDKKLQEVLQDIYIFIIFYCINCIPRTKYVRGILWFSRRYAASASADTSSFSR